MKGESASGDEYDESNVSERVSVDEEEEEEDEEEDIAELSSLDNYQLCLKYQQVPSSQCDLTDIRKAGVWSKIYSCCWM